jgi:amidophosphoribosyltransferase
MCGIVALVGQGEVNQTLYDALTILQHRGQDAAGMMTCEEGHFNLRKGNGQVRDVFHTRHMNRLTGKMGIGHVRYPTAGSSSSAESQPFYVNSPYGLALAHNGNLTNFKALAKDLYKTDLRHVNTNSDSELLLNVLAHELGKLKKLKPEPKDFFTAVKELHKRVKGAYSAVTLVSDYGVLAFRDPQGIRPLSYGFKEENGKKTYMFASESVALQALGFELIGELAPGEAVFANENGEVFSELCAEETNHTPCIFEYVYLARPDSFIEGISVYQSRTLMGEKLANQIKSKMDVSEFDVIIPIPDTSRHSALELANQLNIPYREGFMKNRYIGRTFIMPNQQERTKSVRRKLNAIPQEFEGKHVLFVDDSIVRGTTSKQIVKMARDAGAKKVSVASAAPAICFPNVYGIDMPAAEEFVAHNRTNAEICKELDCDYLFYQELQDLIDSVQVFNPKLKQFDLSVFNGDYVTGDVDADFLASQSSTRGNNTKSDGPESTELNDLHHPLI